MVVNSVEKLASTTRPMENLKIFFQSLSMASCCINPVIYTFMNRKFREKVGIAIISNKTRMLASENKADGGAAMPPRKSLVNIFPRGSKPLCDIQKHLNDISCTQAPCYVVETYCV
ncbi:hypothetical protein DPMN_048016 [Dreissena polymorpha]|uniref:G-protein coupled receptors family 1 profile domain-containing protein n=1 Tax=Dreissena polymorpha TaxID=45954 RepID=A0A9D4I1Y7_DREPO|nr:hypothetical protein DPMN_048016 [Dreissena polymorpha]